MAENIHVHHGTSALSQFRKNRLAADLRVYDVQAHYVHYIALNSSLNPEEQVDLENLLTYDEVSQPTPLSASSGKVYTLYTLYALPRIGTISPWSSKATSIAYVCGFSQKIKRIERGTIYTITSSDSLDSSRLSTSDLLYDRMTQTLSTAEPDLASIFAQGTPKPLQHISLSPDPLSALEKANKQQGLSLDPTEIAYLAHAYGPEGPLNRDPTDVETFMFSQVNSEHCRHKTFNATWTIDSVEKPHSLFDLIRETHRRNPAGTVSAYSDNAAVLHGAVGSYFAPDWLGGAGKGQDEWKSKKELVHSLIKVETHNHPTAIAPFPGAATGSGGEIRDEAAVGRGSKPKAGLCGYSVSDLLIPRFEQPWELPDVGKPAHVASALQIMLEAPIGSAGFNNEFGRPCITGYFRTLLAKVPVGGGRNEIKGYHKPIMIAGGVGSIRPVHALKDPRDVREGDYCVVIGGPAMLIGLGGGAASSMASGEASVELDFASVQRANAEVQRRAQEVINAACAMGADSPIAFIHDVGAGGLSNALPELVHDAGFGATFELRKIDNADHGMSPKEIFCCEAQERYVLVVSRGGMDTFRRICERERCGYSVVGNTTGNQLGEKERSNRLILMDGEDSTPIDLPMEVLFGKPPKKHMDVKTRVLQPPPFDSSLGMYLPELGSSDLLHEAVSRVLALGTVGSKEYLITIGDRSVGGLIARDQMVGPWQIPISDCGVSITSLTIGIKTGEAMAMGERPAIAIISPKSSVRMAVAESLMNIAAADIDTRLDKVKLSANWMAPASSPGQASALYDSVEAVSELCTTLGISVPVGKDSMSMKMAWSEGSQQKEVIAPLSLVVSAFAPVLDVEKIWTPTLRRPEEVGETIILFVDLALGKRALGGSCLAQVFGQVGDAAPDVHDADLLKDYFDAMEQLHESGIVLAYHDRSDGGLFTTLVEMMFAGRSGLEIMADSLCQPASTKNILEALFNEELGAVFQVRKKHETEFHRAFATCGPPKGLIKKIGRVPGAKKQELTIFHGADEIYRASRTYLQQRWTSTSWQMARLRDNPECQDAGFQALSDNMDPGLRYQLTFDPAESVAPKFSNWLNLAGVTNKPRVAILREQGVNGQAEMAFAFTTAGFVAVDVHMSDLIAGRTTLEGFRGLAACGGFSFGDVLGSGRGWANSVLLHPETKRQFKTFFERKDTFTLGVCNGCQFLSRLRALIPGAEGWPTFEKNLSEQHEARTVMVEIPKSSSTSVFFHGMHGSFLPVSVSHGEGRAAFEKTDGAKDLVEQGQVPMRYVTNYLKTAEWKDYPLNPNGSPLGIAGACSRDGRVMVCMPHPERTVLAGTGSWVADGIWAKGRESGFGVWSRIFASARRWVG